LLISDGTVSFFFHKDFKKAAEKIFKNAFLNPKPYLNKIEDNERKISNYLLDEIKTPIEQMFDGKKLNKFGEKKLIDILKQYAVYGDYLDVPGFLFQIYAADDFKKQFMAQIDGKTNAEKEGMFNLVLSSDYLTNYEQFQKDLFSNLNKKFKYKKIAEKYFWVVHDYIGDIVDEKYIEKKVEEINNAKREFKNELKAAGERIKKIKEIKSQLPDDLKEKVEFISKILYLYNDRKKQVINKVNIFIRRLFEYKYDNISVSKIRKLYQLTKEEIIAMLKDEKRYDIEQRSKKWGYFILNEKVTKAPEEYFKLIEVSKNIKELKGIPASSGKATGRVDIILNISHIYKFKRGDILVAPFTNVNYLPIMGKAKAILTESGGLTSHAAIISRELKKPCIVGIKNLISALKDGDEVEIDANKGIVKILNKK
jgi:phosphoenolpyruvate synthase/pyruvate phosphate dikinase